jgi:hypothetical protein
MVEQYYLNHYNNYVVVYPGRSKRGRLRFGYGPYRSTWVGICCYLDGDVPDKASCGCTNDSCGV